MVDFTTRIVTSEELRSVILNAHKIKKDHVCHHCAGTGYTNWNENGDDEKPGKIFEDRTWGSCEKCYGVGFVDVFIYND